MHFTTFFLTVATAAMATSTLDSLAKLREGKCTGAGGDCRVRIKGIPMKKACEMGSRCSSNGSPCFLKGRSWTQYHVSCT